MTGSDYSIFFFQGIIIHRIRINHCLKGGGEGREVRMEGEIAFFMSMEKNGTTMQVVQWSFELK